MRASSAPSVSMQASDPAGNGSVVWRRADGPAPMPSGGVEETSSGRCEPGPTTIGASWAAVA